MSRPVHWTRAALDDLKAQIEYIAADNVDAAEKVAARLSATAVALGEMATGRHGRVSGTYEKSVHRLPYILAYEFDFMGRDEVIVILRVIHTARNWPPENWPE